MGKPEQDMKQTTPLSAFSGALMAATIAILLYRLTHSIALSFATHPSQATSQMAQTLSGAVRTLVVGLSTLATGLSAMATIGLVALGIKLLVETLSQRPVDSE